MHSFDRVLSCRPLSIPSCHGTRLVHLLLIALFVPGILQTAGCTQGPNGYGVYYGDDDSGSSGSSSDGGSNGGADGSSDGSSSGGVTPTWPDFHFEYEEDNAESGDGFHGGSIMIESSSYVAVCYDVTDSYGDHDYDEIARHSVSSDVLEQVWEAAGPAMDSATDTDYPCVSSCDESYRSHLAYLSATAANSSQSHKVTWDDRSQAPQALLDLATLSQHLMSEYCSSLF